MRTDLYLDKRILDMDGNEVHEYDEKLYDMQDETIFIAHHEAVEAKEAVIEERVLKEYPNGGKDVEYIEVSPAVEAAEEWDEYEDIIRITPFSETVLSEHRIMELKGFLQETDFVTNKIVENEANREKYADTLKDRDAWRKEINEIEGKLK